MKYERIVALPDRPVNQELMEDWAVEALMEFKQLVEVRLHPKKASEYSRLTFGRERIVLAAGPTGRSDLKKQWVTGGAFDILPDMSVKEAEAKLVMRDDSVEYRKLSALEHAAIAKLSWNSVAQFLKMSGGHLTGWGELSQPAQQRLQKVVALAERSLADGIGALVVNWENGGKDAFSVDKPERVYAIFSSIARRFVAIQAVEGSDWETLFSLEGYKDPAKAQAAAKAANHAKAMEALVDVLKAPVKKACEVETCKNTFTVSTDGPTVCPEHQDTELTTVDRKTGRRMTLAAAMVQRPDSLAGYQDLAGGACAQALSDSVKAAVETVKASEAADNVMEALKNFTGALTTITTTTKPAKRKPKAPK